MDVEQEDNDDALWVTSYADLISAILAVLVLMASFSKVDVEAFDAVQRVRNMEDVETLAQIKERLAKIAKQNDIVDEFRMEISKDGLGINFNSVMMFSSGSAKLNYETLNSKMEPIMLELAKVGKDRFVDIVGHTDDTPFNGFGGRNNWNLSAERAASLHKYMMSLGMPSDGSRLIAYADTKPITSVKNLKSEEKIEEARQLNRRVSLIIGFIK